MNDLRGFECIFRKKQDLRDFLAFQNVDLSHCYFQVVDGMVCSNRTWMEIPETFEASYFQAPEIRHLVVDHLTLHVYPKGEAYTDIDTYEDFQNSKAELLILICDFYYLELYCKRPDWLLTLLQNARTIPDVEIDLKYPDTDPRTEMYV